MVIIRFVFGIFRERKQRNVREMKRKIEKLHSIELIVFLERFFKQLFSIKLLFLQMDSKKRRGKRKKKKKKTLAFLLFFFSSFIPYSFYHGISRQKSDFAIWSNDSISTIGGRSSGLWLQQRLIRFTHVAGTPSGIVGLSPRATFGKSEN